MARLSIERLGRSAATLGRCLANDYLTKRASRDAKVAVFVPVRPASTRFRRVEVSPHRILMSRLRPSAWLGVAGFVAA